VSQPPHADGTLSYRLTQVEKEVADLEARMERRLEAIERKLDKALWALVGLAISVSSATLVYLLTNTVPNAGG
jgi:hypothetical protein